MTGAPRHGRRAGWFPIAALLAVMSIARPAAALDVRAADAWAGKWDQLENPPEVQEVYYFFTISLSGDGFDWQSSNRDLPYGPNEANEDGHAVFVSDTRAEDRAKNLVFTLGRGASSRRTLTVTAAGAKEGRVLYFVPPYYQAGFDCSKASTALEKAICGDKRLAWADREMNGHYRAARTKSSGAQQSGLLAGQREWIRQRNACEKAGRVDAVCLGLSYANRLAALVKVNDPDFGTAPRFDGEYLLGLQKRRVKLERDVPFLLVLATRDREAAMDIADAKARELAYTVRDTGGTTTLTGRYHFPYVCFPADCRMNVTFTVETDKTGAIRVSRSRESSAE